MAGPWRRACGLKPFADNDGANDGNRHEQVHIWPEAPEREPCLRNDVPTLAKGRGSVDEPNQDGNLMRNASTFRAQDTGEATGQPELRQETEQDEKAAARGQGQPPMALPPGRTPQCNLAIVSQQFCPHPGGVDPCQHFRQGNAICSGDGEAPAQEIESQVVVTANERRDLPSEERDLFGAIHAVDPNRYNIGTHADPRRANLLRSTY